MDGKNGYFKLSTKDDGTYITLFNLTGDGNPINYDEIINYLIDIKMYEYDKTALGRALVTLKNTIETKLSFNIIEPQNEFMRVDISDEKMYAKVRFYPPSDGGTLLTSEDIVKNLVTAGVKYGIDEESINKFVNDRRYCTDYILANAKPAVQGHDAQIKYYFNTDLTMKPKYNEDGSVDFHKLDMISHCKKDDLLATLVPVDYGDSGIDVCGNVLRPKKVNKAVLKHGNNIHLSEDGLNMYSDVNGHVTIAEGRVFVSDTYEIPADVDSSTGDIEYEGSVLIRGNVITGFTVKARGNIEVSGVVEGAYLEAGGQIILRRGMQGMNKGLLKAEGNVISKFIENTEVISGGYVSTESVMHSKVSARGDILVGGRRGLVTGGELRSGTLISVKTVGSHMGTSTLLEVGAEPNVSEEFRELEKIISVLKSEKEKVGLIITMYRKKLQLGGTLSKEKINHLKEVTRESIFINTKLIEARKRYDELKLQMEGNVSGHIKVQDTAYPGTKIVISNVVYFVRDPIQHSVFRWDRAEIKVSPL